jgi:hypothetical protein
MVHLNQEWEVRSLDDLDPQGLLLVAKFFNEQFPGVFYPECTPELFNWKLGSSNPAGRGFLTVAICNGLVVGTTSGTRKVLSEKGNTFEAIEIGDTFTHPDFRKSGKCISPNNLEENNDKYFSVSVFGRLVSETISRAQKSGVKFIYSTPNENSKPPYIKRFDFNEISDGKISSNLIITKRYKPIQKMQLIQIIFSFITKIYTHTRAYFVLGKNSIHEIHQDEFLSNLNQEYFKTNAYSDKVHLVRDKQILQHRYVLHPSHKYRYFQVKIKGVSKGILITTVVRRSSGVTTLVVSDWLFSDQKVEKRLALFISKLLPHILNAETISFWEREGYSKMTKLLLGIIKHKKVSLISKDFRNLSGIEKSEFGNFPIGWSDNG